MPPCNHDHHHSTTADVYTKLGAGAEAVASLISDAYWIGGLFDLAMQYSDDGYGLSWYGFGVGIGVAMLTSVGTAYSHTVLNINHQHQHHHHHHHPAPAAEAGTELQPLLPTTQTAKVAQEAEADHAHNISWKQVAALACDFVSHTGDLAGPITFIGSIMAKDRLNVWGKLALQGGATLFGAVGSIANTRTCANSMRKRNEDLAEMRSFAATA